MREGMLRMDKDSVRRRVRAERDREWLRDAILLKGKTPEETLLFLFDLCEFARSLSAVTETKAESGEENVRREER